MIMNKKTFKNFGELDEFIQENTGDRITNVKQMDNGNLVAEYERIKRRIRHSFKNYCERDYQETKSEFFDDLDELNEFLSTNDYRKDYRIAYIKQLLSGTIIIGYRKIKPRIFTEYVKDDSLNWDGELQGCI